MARISIPILSNTQTLDTAASANSGVLRDGSGNVTNAKDTCSQFVCTGSVTLQFVTKTASYAITATGDCLIECDSTAGVMTLTLPAPASVGAGFRLEFIKKSSDANAITIAPNAAETINGASSKTFSTQYQRIVMNCNGTNWYANTTAPL